MMPLKKNGPNGDKVVWVAKHVEEEPGNGAPAPEPALEIQEASAPEVQPDRSLSDTIEFAPVKVNGVQDASGSVAVLKKPKKKEPGGSLFAWIGNMLYTLGFTAEYFVTMAWRVVRDVATSAGQILAWMAGRLAGALVRAVRGIAQDMAKPMRNFRRRRQQLYRIRQRAKERGELDKSYRGVQVKTSIQLAGTLAGYAAIFLAVAALVFTVNNMMSWQYGLRVEYEGNELGFVTDQSVVEGAKGLLRDRIRLAGNQEVSDWQLTPSYTIARTQEFTTTQELVNTILRTSTEDESDIVSATGLYINEELVMVTTEGEALKEYLDNVLAEERAAAAALNPEAEVSFVEEVVCEPERDDVYFASSVEGLDTIVRKLESDVESEKSTLTDGQTTLEDIAHAGGITLDVLLERNPELVSQAQQLAEETGEDLPVGEYVPEAGQELLIHKAEPYLQVQTSYLEQSTEEIPYNTVEVETEERLMNARVTTQEGANGLREVWDEVYYIDGELDRRVRLEDRTVVIQEAVDEIIEIGTKKTTSAVPNMPEGGYGDGYVFPVPDSPYSSRGMGAGHFGLDINAPAGSSIFAIQGGTVVTAGWHYSYGNHVVIEHPGGVQSLYAHCIALYVSAGEQVKQGQNIAAVGSTGDSTGNHCHLEIRVGGGRVNPVAYVGYPY